MTIQLWNSFCIIVRLFLIHFTSEERSRLQFQVKVAEVKKAEDKRCGGASFLRVSVEMLGALVKLYILERVEHVVAPRALQHGGRLSILVTFH